MTQSRPAGTSYGNDQDEKTQPLVVVQQGKYLLVSFAEPQRTASWAIVGGGLRTSRVVAWHEVSNGELDADVDAEQLLRGRLEEAGIVDAVGLLTSRNLDAFHHVTRRQGDAEAQCVATVGLSNAVRIGEPSFAAHACGTINVLCHISVPLTDSALLEAMALAAEAKTAAVCEAGFRPNAEGLPATGTGTDCIVVASPLRAVDAMDQERYAGKHTLVGHLIGASAYEAIRLGVQAWLGEYGSSQSKPRPLPNIAGEELAP